LENKRLSKLKITFGKSDHDLITYIYILSLLRFHPNGKQLIGNRATNICGD
jgi:hypothetical protein